MKTRWTGSAIDRDIRMLGKHCSRKENWTYNWTSKIRGEYKGGYLAQRLVYSMCLVSVCFFNDDLTVHGLRGPEFLPNSIQGPSALAHLCKTHSHTHCCDNLQMINNGYWQVTRRGKFSRREGLHGRILPFQGFIWGSLQKTIPVTSTHPASPRDAAWYPSAAAKSGSSQLCSLLPSGQICISDTTMRGKSLLGFIEVTKDQRFSLGTDLRSLAAIFTRSKSGYCLKRGKHIWNWHRDEETRKSI